MRTMWLIANSMSKSTDHNVIEDICACIEDNGYRLTRQIDLSKETLPASGRLPDIIACLGGDGTANAAIERFGSEPDVSMLVLPGGTMNLLARKLHGDADSETIIARSSFREHIVQLPQITGPDFASLVGVIAGATAAWGDVREALRTGNVEHIVEEARAALQVTLSPPTIAIDADESLYNALFIEPQEHGLQAQEIKADTVSDIAQHGWAWLNRDFLGGPLNPITRAKELTLSDNSGAMSLLVDGERIDAPSPLRLRWEMCPARFLSTVQS